VAALDQAAFDALVERIYEAGLDPRSWPAFLEQLSRTFSPVWGALHCHDHRANLNVGLLFSGYEPSYADAYRQYYASINPWSHQPAFAG
jgi:hypothetical protein